MTTPGIVREAMSDRFLCLTDDQARAIRACQPDDDDLRAAARRLALLGDPTRIRIALVLRDARELCVGDTANLLGLNIALVSHHARALAANGLATKERQGKLIRYRLTPAAIDLLAVAFSVASTAVDA
jgi:DNA-binding transcriptional ArsR family regulator